MAVTKYAQNNGVHIAYRVVGEGPIDVVVVCGTMSHLDLWFSDRLASSMVQGLATFARVILFDKPGTGLSDPIPGAPTLDQRVDDIVSVMDAFDAMVSSRPYRKGLPLEEAIRRLEADTGKQFDPIVTPKFIALARAGASTVFDAARDWLRCPRMRRRSAAVESFSSAATANQRSISRNSENALPTSQ